MPEYFQTNASPNDPVAYQIRIVGHLGDQWNTWFGDVKITWLESGDTLMTSAPIDQAALHALLKKVRDLGAPLVSVIRLEHDEEK